MEKIGFIGLGNMGTGMAQNLLLKGTDLTVFTRTKSKIDDFVTKGARASANVASLAKESELVLACLPDIETSLEVFLGDRGLLSSIEPGSIIIDHSTVDVETSKIIWKKSLEKNVYFIDAPISGGPVGAKEGTLTIMCGGDGIAFNKAKPVLEKMGTTVVHMGGSGTGTSMKLVNQLLTSVNSVAAMEAMIFADKGGIDLKSVIKVLSTSFGNSRMVERNGPIYIREKFSDSSAPTRNIVKDLRIILDLKNELNLKLPLTELSYELFKETNKLAINEPDISAVALVLKKLSEGNRE